MKVRLGVDTYATQSKIAGSLIDLSWTTDENQFLSFDLNKYMNDLLFSEIGNPMALWTQYPVMDPYGACEMAKSAFSQFNVTLSQDQITIGAGVTSLICHLAKIHARSLHIIEPAYLDLSHWLDIAQKKYSISHIKAHSDEKTYFLEHPNFYSDSTETASLISRLNKQHNGKATIIVDESNANYLPPEQSIVRLVNDLPGLVVLRGFSKAYGLGSLRIGACITSPNISSSIRSLFPPLAFTPISLQVASTLWKNGDLQKSLRSRISLARNKFLPLFKELKGVNLIPSNPALPYLMFECCSKNLFDKIGITTKLHTMSVALGKPATICRLSLPLRDERQITLLSILERADAQ
jgi:histidinol-phosphate/aromatic aminotransferase/cobyric acid decarboxylase-like protein